MWQQRVIAIRYTLINLLVHLHTYNKALEVYSQALASVQPIIMSKCLRQKVDPDSRIAETQNINSWKKYLQQNYLKLLMSNAFNLCRRLKEWIIESDLPNACIELVYQSKERRSFLAISDNESLKSPLPPPFYGIACEWDIVAC